MVMDEKSVKKCLEVESECWVIYDDVVWLLSKEECIVRIFVLCKKVIEE